MCWIHTIFFLALCSSHACFPSGDENLSLHLYDQSQNGTYNIHISFKDVAIIDLDKTDFFEEVNDDGEEYYYDDSDLTIKPISSLIATTIKSQQSNANNLTSDIETLKPVENIEEVPVTSSSSPYKRNTSSSLITHRNKPSTGITHSHENEPVSKKKSYVRNKNESHYHELQVNNKINENKTSAIPKYIRLREPNNKNVQTIKGNTFFKNLLELLKLVSKKNRSFK